MDGNNVKKDDENGLLSFGIYSFPAAAPLSLQRLGRRSLNSLKENLKNVIVRNQTNKNI